MADSTSKYIAERVNEWVGEDTPFNEKEVFNFIWAMSMDKDLYDIVQTKILLLTAEAVLTRRESDV